MKKIILIVLPVLLLMSCNRSTNSTNIVKQPEVYSFVATDSLKLNATNLTFDDIKEDVLLFHNPVSFDIFTYDLKNRKLSSFNQFGKAPGNYFLLFKNVFFKNKDTIAVGGFRHLILYSLKGKWIRNIQIQRKETRAPIMQMRFLNDSTMLYVELPQGDTSTPVFYKKTQKVFRKIYLHSGKTLDFVNFPEKGSIYKNGKEYYLHPFLFSYTIKDNVLYAITENEPIIYEYDLETGNLLRQKKINLTYYTPYTIKFGKELNDIQKFYAMWQSGSIQNILPFENDFIIQYTKGYSLDELKEFARTHKDFPQYDYPDMRYCLKWVKKGIDMKVPDRYGELIAVKGNTLLFKKEIDKGDNPITLLYIIKIKNKS